MKKILDQIATALYKTYGAEVSDLYVVFPSKRARLFFNEALLKNSGSRPIWQPHYLSIDDMVRGLSDLEPGDHLRLVAELYKIYITYHVGETFDRFYRWGEMLLADFDTIDKYLIDAESLYANVSDLKDIEVRFSAIFEGDDQRLNLVVNFWRAFNVRTAKSVEQQQFLQIWRSLYEIYRRFKDRLRSLGMAYAGMIYREVADRLVSGGLDDRFAGKTYCLVGFNALNECEKRMFDYLKGHGLARFYWDYDNYYYRSEEQQAGRFIRRNVARFGDSDGAAIGLERDNFEQPKRVEVICAPSDILQCKALYKTLERIHERQGFVDKETAIILTDEHLLLPVLHSIPEVIRNLNITMGYPLISTVPYVLFERLLQLQQHGRQGGEFAYSDVLGILTHPYVVERVGEAAGSMREKMNDWQSVWVPADFFEENGLLRKIFRPVAGYEQMQEYVEEIMSGFGAVESNSAESKERKEFIFTILEHVSKLGETIRACGIDPETGIYISLLRQTLQNVRVPYEGEPLSGLQIMGILETRNLDFDNVILLSMTDDTFPGVREGASYIPFSLRQAFGLPTPQDHEAMYAYYFYRLIARCGDLVMMYSSSADDQRTGEQSRYIYQLEYESPHPVERVHVNLRVDYRPVESISVPKTGDIISRLDRMEFSPTAINHYIDCPLKFYFADLRQLRPPETVTGRVTALDVGNTLHRAMELLYEPLIDRPDAAQRLSAVMSSDVLLATEQAMQDVMGMRGGRIETSGRMQIHRDIVMRYVDNIVRFDAGQRYGGFRVVGLERKAKHAFEFSGRSVVLAGRADRVDRRADGVLQIADYKSGGDKTDFISIENLFTDDGADRQGELCYQPHNGAVLQTLLYALIFGMAERAEVSAALYVARRMETADYSPYPVYKDAGEDAPTHIDRLLPDDIAKLTEGLESLFGGLFDVSIPFLQTEHREKCAYCDFKSICRR